MSEQRPEKKISIVGFTASRELAPWGQEGWEIWVCNNLPKFCPNQWHRLFDLHDMATIQSDPEHAGFLTGNTIKSIDGQDVNLAGRPVVCWTPQPDWPTAVKYPKDQITDTFGRYFTNSISWMIAAALVEGATELHVYGVDMATGTEYAAQRPSCEYMLGVAVGAGVKVHVPVQSDLLKVAAMYGAEDDSALRAKITERQKELRGRQAQVQANMHQAELQNAQLQGAIETTDYFGGVWLNAAANRDGTVKGLEDGKTNLAPETIPEVVEEVAA